MSADEFQTPRSVGSEAERQSLVQKFVQAEQLNRSAGYRNHAALAGIAAETVRTLPVTQGPR